MISLSLNLLFLKSWLDLAINLGRKTLPPFFRDWLWKIIGEKLYYHSLNKKIHIEESYNNSLNIIESIKYLKIRFPEKEEITEKPIFIFSAGMRSGSTWIQRLIMSSSQTIIWGEPYNRAAIIQNMAKQIEVFSLDFPRDDFIYNQQIPDISNQWIANLYPDFEYFRQAHRLFFINLFAVPGREKGVSRWGLKEIRLTPDHAIYLQWLFPQSKLIFLIRNPYHAYQSYKFFTYLSQQYMTAENFGYIWKNLTEGYVMNADKINAKLVKYEDVVQGKIDLKALESYVEIDLIEPNKLKKVSTKDYLPNISQTNKITEDEINILKNIVNPLAVKLGYYPE